MKEEAAKLGANGILLGAVGEKYAGSVSTGSASAYSAGNTAGASGLGISAGIFYKAANGVAIFVEEE